MKKNNEVVRLLMKRLCDELDARKARCCYLVKKFDEMNSVGNTEQAEAYELRIKAHKPRVIELLTALTALEEKLAREADAGAA